MHAPRVLDRSHVTVPSVPPGASTNGGGLGDGSPTISKMGGLPRKDYIESPFRA